MADYKVGVVIATYNSGLFLNAFFDSIMYQSMDFEDIQVIFVDDNSDDEYTLYLLRLFDKNFSNVTSVFLDNNSGFPGRGRNVGLDLIDSEYVIFSDHDDTYTPDAFEVMYNAAKNDDADIVITNYYKVFPDEKIKTKTIFNGENEVINDFKNDLRIFDLDPAIWSKLFRKEFLMENDIRFLEGMLAEDLYFFINSVINSKCSVCLDDFFSYNYNIRNIEGDKSTIHIRNKKYLGKMVEGYHFVDKLLSDSKLEEYYPFVFNNHFIYWLTSLIVSDINDDEKLELIQSVNDLFKKQVMINPGFDERVFSSLTKPILNDDYKKIVKNIKSIKRKRWALSALSGIFGR